MWKFSKINKSPTSEFISLRPFEKLLRGGSYITTIARCSNFLIMFFFNVEMMKILPNRLVLKKQ